MPLFGVNHKPAHFPLEDIKVHQHEKTTTYATVVSIKGKEYNVRLIVSKETDELQARTLLTEKAKKVANLAVELGLGQEKGMKKVSFKQDGVIASYENNETKDVLADLENRINLPLSGVIGQTANVNMRLLQEIKEITVACASIFKPASTVSRSASFVSTGPSQSEQTFNRHILGARGLIHQMHRVEIGRYRELALMYNNALPDDDQSKNKLDELKAKREELLAGAKITRAGFEQTQKDLFEAYQGAMIALSSEYNSLLSQHKTHPTPESEGKLSILKHEIRSLETEFNNFHLSTHTANAYKGHCLAYASTVEKKLDMAIVDLEQKLPGGAKPKTSIIKQIKQSWISKESKNAPNNDRLGEILLELTDPETTSYDVFTETSGCLLSAKEAEEKNQLPKELSWGKSHLNKVLSLPCNWTTIRTIDVKESKEGLLHTFTTIHEPILTGDYGVPSGSRKEDPLKPCNFYRTKRYMDGVIEPVSVTYRAGQFPSKEAAQVVLKTIIDDLKEKYQDTPLQEADLSLHINSLMTPTSLTAIKKDRPLLKEHKQNIVAALEELKTDSEYAMYAEALHTNLAHSNFGVNEGAVAEHKQLRWAQLGWHTSIFDYSNDATQQLNGHLLHYFESIQDGDLFDPQYLEKLDKLGGIFHLTAELEAIWSRNDFASAKAGNNQFKMPAKWRTLDNLLNVAVITNCKSAKDRTSMVESASDNDFDEILMNIQAHKRLLKDKFDEFAEKENDEFFDPEIWVQYEDILTSACFTDSDLVNLSMQCNDVEAFEAAVKNQIAAKVRAARNDLDISSTSGPFDQKAGFGSSPIMKTIGQNLHGISQSLPKTRFTAQFSNLPEVTQHSIYSAGDYIEEDQRMAVNRRKAFIGGLPITQTNAGIPGFKVKGGEPYRRAISGFDRDYLINQLLEIPVFESRESWIQQFIETAGLDELDAETRSHLIAQMKIALKKTKRYEAVLHVVKEIEKAKSITLKPSAHVA